MRWSVEALDEFESAVTRLRAKNPAAAERYVEDLNAALAGLARRNTGRLGRVPGTFEKSLPKWRYVIAFQILRNAQSEEALYIVRIIHTSRNWPKGAWPKSS
ncbi:MAG: type II toxin-antitoxin system RelE/ParE family toxin [Hyphomonadaceae bacterium]